MNNVKQFDLFPLPQALQYIEEPLKKSIFKLNAYYVTYSSCCGHEPDNIVKIGIIIEDFSLLKKIIMSVNKHDVYYEISNKWINGKKKTLEYSYQDNVDYINRKLGTEYKDVIFLMMKDNKIQNIEKVLYECI